MATFPSLAPSAAPITPGAWPVSALNSLNGAESRIRQGSAQIGRRLQLTFANITEANFLAILAHYQGQRSGFDPFGFDTATLAADLTPAGHAWLYASRPQVVDEHLDVFTVVCEFKSEPRGLVVAPGKMWRTPKTVLGKSTSEGVMLATIETTFAPGVANSGIGSKGVNLATGSTLLRPQAAPDPFFSSVVFLLGFNGTSGSTTIVDEGPLSLNLTALENAQISTTQSVSGGSSLSLDGSSSIQLPSISSLNIAGDFTLDARCRFNQSKTDYLIGASNENYLARTATSLQAVRVPGPVIGSASFTAATNTWYALRWARSGSTMYFFVDGALIGTATVSGAFPFSGGKIGVFGIQTNKFAGFIDEMRLTTVCRSTASYALDATPLSRV
jgi:hypothetical protein